MSWLTGLLSKFGKWLAGVAVMLLIIIAYVSRATRQAKQQAETEHRADQAEQTIKNVKVSHEVEQDVNAISDSAIDERMRQQGYFRE